MQWPNKVLVREVGPRDGLQNENTILTTEKKISLIKQLISAGITAIEATSFVHPRAVPQLSDAEAVLEGLGDPGSNVIISALVGNIKGMQRALKVRHTSLREIVVVVSASEAHNQANLNRSVPESLAELKEICLLAEGIFRVRGTVSTAFGCPYQGNIEVQEVVRVIEGMRQVGIQEIALADTAGMGNPRQIYNLLQEVLKYFPGTTWALHLHDNKGLGLANCVTGMLAGASVLESSIGGLGGCPFLPGATGNVDTAEVVYMLQQMGIFTGVDLQSIMQSGESVLGWLIAVPLNLNKI